MSITKNSKLELLYDSDQSTSSADAIHDMQAGVEPGHSKVSYRQLYKLADGLEECFRKRSIERHKKVLILGRNSSLVTASVIALWRLGATVIPVDFRMTVNEMANIAERVDACLVIVDSALVDLKELAEKMGDRADRILTLSDLGKVDTDTVATSKEVQKESDDFQALVILTSGTTGMPKGAVHSFNSLMKNLSELGDLVNLTEKKVVLLPLPVSHIFGLEVLMIALKTRATVVFCDLDPASFVNAINTHRPHIIAGVPTIYGALLMQGKEVVQLDRAEVLLSGGAPLPIPMARQFEAEFGKRLNNGYGSTESKIICLNLDGPLESVGKPIPSVKINIVDEAGNCLPEGETGEIYIESKLLMDEYLNQPEKTEDVLTENGYRTGDIGHLADSYLFISGRAKEMIIVAGNKVFPIEVEQVLSRHPLVKEVAVTGQDHQRLGQIVKATIVVADASLGEALDGEDEAGAKAAREEILKSLKEFSKENLKRELRPMVWNLRALSNPLPKTRSGKVDKKLL